MFGSFSRCVQLIDFGRSIDMKFFPPGTTFDEYNSCEGFTCPQMLEGKPWAYETDYFGVAGTLYVILCGRYMEIVQDVETGKWRPRVSVPRRRMACWTALLDSMINCRDGFLDLQALRLMLLEEFLNSDHLKDSPAKIQEMATLMEQKNLPAPRNGRSAYYSRNWSSTKKV
ncbi:unnamed protein product [Cyprideis torosa]|uniref:Uncharacterized protein n=1 Tax=Cyprideis torosa TaxID=163714 RepID=A0A7R8WNN8_9CRUS|nr:unnamed protein product [Cyprideis torosa]CAG0904925.1 unnamed protein product [Cyprideis torosa]